MVPASRSARQQRTLQIQEDGFDGVARRARSRRRLVYLIFLAAAALGEAAACRLKIRPRSDTYSAITYSRTRSNGSINGKTYMLSGPYKILFCFAIGIGYFTNGQSTLGR